MMPTTLVELVLSVVVTGFLIAASSPRRRSEES
jgi:hypothetical protein